MAQRFKLTGHENQYHILENQYHILEHMSCGAVYTIIISEYVILKYTNHPQTLNWPQ